MYQTIYKIEILKEYLAGVIANYFQYMKDNKTSIHIQENYNRLREIYSSIIFVDDMNELNELEKEIKEYKRYIDELQL